jgi:alpha-beta hydrolase superfamily lysophospholipase
MRFLFTFSFLLLASSGYCRITEKVVLSTATGKIHGTLTLPQSFKKAMPLVIFIVGSGPTDRDGNQINLRNNSHLYLADSLAKRGIATLRYDKRGIGESKPAALDESALRFDYYVDDAAGWVKQYKTDKRFSKVIIAGHSEGSLIGILAAQREAITGLISIAGIALPADSVVMRQLAASPGIPPVMIDSMRLLFSALRRDGSVENIPGGFYQALLRRSVQPYMVSWMKYNPAEEIAKLKIPILVVQGKNDTQVDTTQAVALAAASKTSKLVMVEGMNHVLKAAAMDQTDQQESYIMPDRPVKTELVKAIYTFVQTVGKK